MRRDSGATFRALAGLALALLAGCAAAERREVRATPVPLSPATPSAAPVTVLFRVAVAVDGKPRPVVPSGIHFVRTDLVPAWHPDRRMATGDPRVRSLAPEGSGWYAVDLLPGRYHLNLVHRRRFPTPRALPPLLVEIPPGDRIAFAGSIEVNCRDRVPPKDPGSQRYDCVPPTIRTDDAATAARLAGDATVDPAIRAARPLTALTSPGPFPREGGWTLEQAREATAGPPVSGFPHVEQAVGNTAVHGGVGLAGSLLCGPWFVFCAAFLVAPAVVGGAIDVGVEHHGNEDRGTCSERLGRELQDLDAERRLRVALRERFAGAGRPLSDPTGDPSEPSPAIVLRVAVLRIGVRGDTCVPGVNPFKQSDRYRADILAGVQAVDGTTGAVLYEEFLTNTEKLSLWDVLAGRGSLTPVGSRAACRRVKEFCPDEEQNVLGRDLEPAIDAFAGHVLRVLDGAAGRSVPSP